jgi:hypothetical protein
MYQDFVFNIDPNANENIKRNWTRTDYTYEEYIFEKNEYITNKILDNKILLNIYMINNEYYILDSYLQSIAKKRYNIRIWDWLYNNLFNKFNVIKSECINLFKPEYLKLDYNYIQYNNEILKVINFTNFIKKSELEILYSLTKTNNLNSEIIKICGTKNKEEQEYYKFIFKNIKFNFINYKSDIDKLKEEYDNKIQRLTDKIKELEMLILKH